MMSSCGRPASRMAGSTDLVTEIKRAFPFLPSLSAGSQEPQYAELLVKQGRCDLVAFGRQSIADPELPNKARNNQLETLAPCIGCLLGCVPNMFAGRPITCAVNPCVGEKPKSLRLRLPKTSSWSAAARADCTRRIFLALRGHKVTLLEKNRSSAATSASRRTPPARAS